ncbi:MAG: twin transmembrane helix small protein [Legionellaceae bacterium]|nr:twin transmembrane helix small protein [Legionellaceae bacterium]
MFIKIIIFIIMLFILGALTFGLINLVRDQGKTQRTVKSLTVRIILSVGLFIFLFFAFKFQWIAPHGV